MYVVIRFSHNFSRICQKYSKKAPAAPNFWGFAPNILPPNLGILGGGGGQKVPFRQHWVLKNCLLIITKRHFSTIYHIFCFGTGLQVDNNSGEGCAGFSEKAFDLCKT